MEKKDKVERAERTGGGSVRIADEVVGIIAGLAATEVAGIAGMSAGLVGGIAEMLGRKNLSKGVKVEVGEKEAAVDLYIIAEYGARIPEVALHVQENVKKAIKSVEKFDKIFFSSIGEKTNEFNSKLTTLLKNKNNS